MRYDVAIVGYGPTGMALAAFLGQLGRSVIVLERYQGLYNLPRAACWDDETMRSFQAMGIAEQMLPGTQVQPGYHWVNGDGETLLEIEYDNPGRCGWPQQYMMYQPHMEDVLDRHIQSLPSVEVQQGVTVTGVTEGAQGVTVSAQRADGTLMRVEAAYVVGADGGNGPMRKHLGGALDDYNFMENWLVVDFEMRRPVEGLPSFRQVCDPKQPIAIVNIGPKHHRFSFMLDPGDTREEVSKPENVWPRVRDYLTPEDADLIRVANYTFTSAIVDHWRKGRIMLAGDAAHQMPPFLAQGMVSGIRDARNLAWKLDMVLSGYPDDLLDSYQPEREPHVRFITEKAIKLGRVQTMRDPVKARARDARMMAAHAANQAPEKLRYPALSGGMIATYGDLLPQGEITDGTRTGLFDDIAGRGWQIVTRDPTIPTTLSDADRRDWAKIKGGTTVFGPNALTDTSGTLTRWFDDTGCDTAILRPDSYVYGISNTAADLHSQLAQLFTSLGLR